MCVLSLARPVAAADSPAVEAARRHFQRGAALYDERRYEEAIVEMEEARSAQKVPALDYNIARCYDMLDKLEPAIENYLRYVESHPADEASIAERIAILRARLAVRAPRPAPVPVEAPAVVQVAQPRPSRVRYSVGAPAAVGGVALLSFVAGGALYGVSGARFDTLPTRCLIDCSDFRDRTRTMERAGIGLFIAGGVLAAVDVALWSAWRKR